MSHPNRTVCDVLKEMRKAHETSNYSYLLGLIEEVQSMANRMESSLYDKSDIKYSHKEIKKLNKQIEALKLEKSKLKGNEGEDTREHSINIR